MKAALLRSDSVNLAELRRVLTCKGFNVRRSLKGWYVESVVGLSAVRIKAITIKVYIPLIYFVNTGLQSKYYKEFFIYINIYYRHIYILGQLVIHLFVPVDFVWPAVDQMRGALVPSEL